MTSDDEFEPRLGRMRSQGGKRVRGYIGRVLAAANLARGGSRFGLASSSFSGSRIGRAAGTGRLLAARSSGGLSRRRVIIKASIVRLAGKGAAGAAAHLRYLQRDGTTREGLPGALYDAERDVLDGRSFRARGVGDRHQFRFIVSAEDGAEYDDLKPLTRRLMEQIQEDLGTKLDWVAVNHFNTGHPHTHIVVRGKDHRGADLVIAREYLTNGIRERACELVELDLGPRSARDVEAGRRAEMEQERFTSLDRALLRDMVDDGSIGPSRGNPIDQALRTGRLAKLARLGLAEPQAGGRWTLSPELEGTLRRMGEQGDIIRTMQRAFSVRSLERSPTDQVIYDPAAEGACPLVGRVVERGLADEHADRHYLIVDAIDGRSHYVPIGRGDGLDALPEGSIVRLTPTPVSARDVDRTVAAVAAGNGGRYDIDAHLRHDPSATEAFAQAHVRRLEAMRRLSGSVSREPSGSWIIADDHLSCAAAHEARVAQDRPVVVERLSTKPPRAEVEVDAATWLDRDLVAAEPLAPRDAGFGAEVREAQARRRQWLMAQGFAEESGGVTSYRADLLATLQRRELLRVAGQLSDELGIGFVEVETGKRIEGVLRRSVDLVSSRFALVENGREFTLVPWRPVLERQVGKAVSGIMRGEGVSWSFGRGRGGPVVE